MVPNTKMEQEGNLFPSYSIFKSAGNLLKNNIVAIEFLSAVQHIDFAVPVLLHQLVGDLLRLFL